LAQSPVAVGGEEANCSLSWARTAGGKDHRQLAENPVTLHLLDQLGSPRRLLISYIGQLHVLARPVATGRLMRARAFTGLL